MTKFFLEANFDTWWLSFRLSNYDPDHMAAVVEDVEARGAPRGDIGTVWNPADYESFSFEWKRSDGITNATINLPQGGWVKNTDHQYGYLVRPFFSVVDGVGYVDVRLVLPFDEPADGCRLHFALWANGQPEPESPVAAGEILWIKELNREENGEFCEDDDYLCFRLKDGEVETTHIGPVRMSGQGDAQTYDLETKYTFAGQEFWQPGEFGNVLFDERTQIVDCYIGGTIPYEIVEEGSGTLEFRLVVFEPGASRQVLWQGPLSYISPCPGSEGSDQGTKYYITTDSDTEALLFRLSNYEPDISDAIVVSVTTSDIFDESAELSEVLFFQYAINGDGEWQEVPCTYIEEIGTAQVALGAILPLNVSFIEFRLVFDG